MRFAAALLVTLSLAGPAPSLAGEEKAAVAAIHFSFKLDPRVLGPTYGGERWGSPPTYTGASGQDAIEVRASAVDARGTPAKESIGWSPSDPEMVTVTPAGGDRVKIVVKRPGESGLMVKSGGASRKLTIKAVQPNGIWQVTITQ